MPAVTPVPITIVQANNSGWVQSSNAGIVKSDGTSFGVGGWADYIVSLLSFDISSLPSNVTSAKVYIYTGETHKLSTKKWDRIQGSWTYSTLTWNNKPGGTNNNEGTSFSARLDAGWDVIDITTLYNQWKDGTYTNYGISINGGASSYSNIYDFWKGHLYDLDTTKRPYLEVVV